MYHTPIELSPTCMEDLKWWYEFLEVNPGNASWSGTAGTLLGTWGDCSGTGTGGTMEEQKCNYMDTWMGTCSLSFQLQLEGAANSALDHLGEDSRVRQKLVVRINHLLFYR
jgi:hypothetical protein